MASGVSAAPRPRAAWRIMTIAAAVAAFVGLLTGWAAAQTPLIKIPPAQLAAPAAPGAPQGVPRSLLPTRVQILRDGDGTGIALYGALTGKAAAATAVVQAVFVNSEAFDPTPVIRLMVADEGDRQAQALFSASVRGRPVLGVAIAALSETGGDVTLFYDTAAGFPASFPRMREALDKSDGVGIAELAPLRLGDGNTVGIPAGWEATAQGIGTVTLQGRQGEWMTLGATMPVYGEAAPGGVHVLRAPCCDPVNAFAVLYPQIVAAPRPAVPPQEPGSITESQPLAMPNGGNAALILSEVRVGGDDYDFLVLAETVAGFTDPWTFTLSGEMAPTSVFAAELPTLIEIWRSYSGNRPGFGDALKQAASALPSIAAMLKSSIGARETGEYDADPGWDPLVARLAADGDAAIDPSLAQSLVERVAGRTGRRWHVVTPADSR